MITLSTFALCFWGAVTLILGIVIGKLVALNDYNKRIRAMMHLPNETMSLDDLKESASNLQHFICKHLFVKRANGFHYYNRELSKTLTREEFELSRIKPSTYTMALVGVCHKLGLEIVLREKNGGEERILSA